MSWLTYLTEATVEQGVNELEGKVHSPPQLIYTDGFNVTYGCDVDIGQEGVINENGDIGIVPLRNVPIAANNRELIYAEVGQAVTVRKNSSRHWEVVGLAKSMPGTFTMTPVTISGMCWTVPVPDPVVKPPFEVIIGTPIEIGIVVRPLTYEELGVTYGTYGVTPYGAYGVFVGGELQEIRSV